MKIASGLYFCDSVISVLPEVKFLEDNYSDME